MADDTTQVNADKRPVGSVGRAVGTIRYLAVLAVVGLTVTTLATSWIALGKTIELVRSVVDDKTATDLLIVKVLVTIDGYLLAVVQLIVAMGLYELFVGEIDVPKWLDVRSLDDLKKPIIDVLVVFLAVNAIESYLVAKEAADAMQSSIGAAVLVGTLTAYRFLSAKKA